MYKSKIHASSVCSGEYPSFFSLKLKTSAYSFLFPLLAHHIQKASWPCWHLTQTFRPCCHGCSPAPCCLSLANLSWATSLHHLQLMKTLLPGKASFKAQLWLHHFLLNIYYNNGFLPMDSREYSASIVCHSKHSMTFLRPTFHTPFCLLISCIPSKLFLLPYRLPLRLYLCLTFVWNVLSIPYTCWHPNYCFRSVSGKRWPLKLT